MLTQKQIELDIDALIAMSEKYQSEYQNLPFESKEWQYARDAYITLSNAVEFFMNKKTK